MIPKKAIQAIHSAICEESLEDHMDHPEWPGRCVKAAQAAAPYMRSISAEDIEAVADMIKAAKGADRPRVVEVCHDRDGYRYSDRDQIRYGQAITGWPIRLATITEAPRNDDERAWIDEVLATFITPKGRIIHAYKEVVQP